mgnify:CR=1 FL=1
MAFGDIGGAVTELVITCQTAASGSVAIAKGDALKLSGAYTVTNATLAEDAIFGQALGGVSDWLITIDPHLHRLASIGAVYPRSASVLHAIAPVAAWIRNHVEEPLIVGPDVESRQWTEAVADATGAPFIVMEKTRRGDRAVEVTAPDLAGVKNRTPVLLDDIISTARTMIAAMALLRENEMKPAVCVGIHGVFAEGAYEDLLAAGAARVASTNTIAHLSNAIDVSDLIAEALRERFAIP